MTDHKPSLIEIARGLSVTQRWNGMTIVPWSVLQHSVLVWTALPEDASLSVRLYALLHDSAEMYLGDIPRPYKVPEQYDLEDRIIEEIFGGLGLTYPVESVKTQVKHADNLVGAAEAEVLIPLAKRRQVRNGVSNPGSFSDEEIVEVTETIWSMRDMNRNTVIDLWIYGVTPLLEEYQSTGIWEED